MKPQPPDSIHDAIKTLKILAVGAVILVALGVGAIVIFADRASSSADRSTQAAKTAVAANRKASEGKQIAVAVEQAREKSLRQSCEGTNAAHRNTIRSLDRILGAAERRAHTAKRRRVIAASRTPTVLLINALAPYRNCTAYVRQNSAH